jgi:hypothetical protein
VAAQHPRSQCPSGRVLKAKEPVKRVAGGETIGRRKWGDTQWHDQLQGDLEVDLKVGYPDFIQFPRTESSYCPFFGG